MKDELALSFFLSFRDGMDGLTWPFYYLYAKRLLRPHLVRMKKEVAL
jgi:hypothetical protein